MTREHLQHIKVATLRAYIAARRRYRLQHGESPVDVACDLFLRDDKKPAIWKLGKTARETLDLNRVWIEGQIHK